MTTTTAPRDRMTSASLSPPLPPRLRMEPTGSSRTLLDGGWWPRSTDPVTELPGLVLAIGTLRGPVTRLILSADGWDTHPRRLGVAGRILRLGYFTSQPLSLLTAICANRSRVDLLVVPPHITDASADAAMILAATATNVIHAQHIPLTISAPPVAVAEDAWEDEGGHMAGSRRAPSRRQAIR
ncbi:hypothetical protein FHR83_006190 [Actinoplanes campanulatus]|uniref:Uncharacterized protein n=1 Tax=Actinoplanes campanulatus TaxID=113559 RepID=A0A7W5ALJ7_9ACTN|nr:DUF5994 family protein [Actinoplanes campanulatus]MBB3098491.1 hypothetical protein [Actinoplanes campanulatus]GGN35511.1 hypothetical protein GCM10010109_59620 [Actinoplanes campanulatus]GID39185.1 hypothetical protein Aca09nite_56910 [Actinoplanes campanulatus]